MACRLQVIVSVYSAAAVSPAASLPKNSHAFLPELSQISG
jgi:hypothetical protein